MCFGIVLSYSELKYFMSDGVDSDAGSLQAVSSGSTLLQFSAMSIYCVFMVNFVYVFSNAFLYGHLFLFEKKKINKKLTNLISGKLHNFRKITFSVIK